MKIGDFSVENFARPYVIAEIGANHNGDFDLAVKLIHAAKEAGCHSAKFQTWSADSIFSRSVYEQNYFIADDYRNRKDYTLREIVEEFSLSPDELRALKKECDRVGIHFSASVFSFAELEFALRELDLPYIKVASMDIPNLDFLDAIARAGRPVILSTGLSSLEEIDRAVSVFEAAGNHNLSILHCVAQYPPKDCNLNLRNITMLQNLYPRYPIGFSDHTIGTAAAVASVALGAAILEKHFTLDKEMFGWDHKVSATPAEISEIVSSCNRIVEALGSYRRVVTPEDMRVRESYRRSIVTARPIPKGKVIERADIDFKRPGTGISPSLWQTVIGCVAQVDIPADEVLREEHFKQVLVAARKTA